MKKKYTYDKCKELSKLYKFKKDFYTNEKGAYHAILKNKWYDLLENFEKIGSKYKRCVYIYQFNENTIYIGLTYNLYKRDKDHRRKGSVFKYALENNLIIPKPTQLSDYIDYDSASILEEKLINEYKERGFLLINKIKGGGLGGDIFYNDISKKDCIEKMNMCKNITEFKNKFHSHYTYAKQNNFYEEIYNKLKYKREVKICVFTENGYFIEIVDSIRMCEKKYNVKSLSELSKNNGFSNGYRFMRYNTWEKLNKPKKVENKTESRKKSLLKTIIKRNENYTKYGNPQFGKKKSIQLRIKKSKPIVMLTLDMKVIDVLYGISFAIEKYNLNKNIGKSLYKVCNNETKSSYGYRWFYLDFYNEKFNSNLTITEMHEDIEYAQEV